ncbi:MAG TPA: hypothetical protein VNB22_17885 [Pyrinomonadaceae bacterium]|nr:hypothetical protein [Pyrinomonadaceae bacterium]
MKRFLSSVALCLSLLLIGLFFFMPAGEAQTTILPGLLSMPAPPPPNPFYRPTLTERDENFFDKKNPPSDDAPIQDLLDYWKHQNEFDPKFTYTVKPSGKSLERLMDEVEKKPELLEELIDVFPETKDSAEFIKRLYDEESSKRDLESSWRTEVKKWLTYHSNYFSSELYEAANQAADTKEYVTNQDEVLALARVDWERAKPLLDRMLSNSNQPVSQTLARWALYKHAMLTNDSFDAEKYRKELQETVENKSLQPGNRDLAMDALVEAGDFPGRDDWYYSLLEDESLYELRVNGQVYTGLTTILALSPDDKYVAKMIELAGSSNQTVRNAAVRNLSTLLDGNKNPDVIRALLPWLENPKWAKEVSGERTKLVTALRSFAIPESVPGLIAMLNEKEKQEVPVYPNSNSNSSIYSTTNRPLYNVVTNVNTAAVRTQTVESYPYRSWAIMALEKQKSPQAAAALRAILPVVENWERQNVVRALLVSNGFTISEQTEALEEVAKSVNEQQNMPSNTASMTSNVNGIYVERNEEFGITSPGLTNVQVYRAQNADPNNLKMLLGAQLVNIEDPGDELVKAVIDRINYNEKKNPPVALAMRQIIQNWKGTAINALLLRDLKDGKSNLPAVVKLLIIRKEMREKQPDDIADIRAGSATALGISACLLEQTNDYDAILEGDNIEAKTAMLSCARLIRAALPVQKVAVNLKSENKLLAFAAERYLESEDSPEARQIVLSLHPNEAKVLGARIAFVPESTQPSGLFSPFTRDLFISVDSLFEKFPPYFFYGYLGDGLTEKKLQKEVLENPELLGVYAYDNNFVRIYKDKTVFSWEDDPARYRERTLSVEEFENLKNFLASQRVDELPPFLSPCPNCEAKELLMLGKGGGRRVFVKAEPLPQFFTELESIFAEFRKQPMQIHYYFEKSVGGLEVLFADENLGAKTLWKDGADFRLVIDDQTLRKQNEKEAEENENELYDPEPSEDENEEMTAERKAELDKLQKENLELARKKEYGSYTWYKFDKTKLLEPTVQPPSVEFIPPVDGFAVQPNAQQWKARAAGVEIRADDAGLYKISRGQLTKIREGYYYKPLVTPNGRWAIVTKFSRGEDEYDDSLVRVNLLTGKEFKIKVESNYGAPETAAFIPALNKVLLFSSYGEGDVELSERSGEFFLLDAETGIVQPLKGEARPLLQQTFRPLQPVAASPDQFWTALPDHENNATQFGIYNTKTLSFKSLLTIPQISFNSLDTWVDEGESKIYFVYEGQLLALPLPKNR